MNSENSTSCAHPTDMPTDCENCGHNGLEQFINTPNHRLLRCPQCNLYQKGFLESNTVYEGEYHNRYWSRRQAKIRTATIRLASTTKYLNSDSPRMLDVGCSVGATLEAAKNLGWDGIGVDISEDAIEFCQAKGLNCQKIEGVKLPFEDDQFDIITNWHVIEHVHDVSETLDEWRRVLKPGGIMILETPDANYLKAEIMGTRYRRFWPAEHLYTFNPKNLSSFLTRSGFEIMPTRLIGKPSCLKSSMNLYALAYRGLREASRKLRLCKSFEICCRKPISASTTRSIAA